MTDLLSSKGFNIAAVEANQDMFYVLSNNNKDNDNVSVVLGRAEDTTLLNNSIDSIIVGQAFHWFDVTEFKRECKRILRDENSKVCLVWNSRDTENEVAKECIIIFKKYCKNFSGFRGGVGSGEKHADTFYKEYEKNIIENDTKFDLLGFLGRNLSMSYAPKCNEKGYIEFIKELTDVYERYNEDGLITVKNNIVYYIGTV